MILHLVRHPPPDVAPGVCYGQLDVAATGAAAAAIRLRPLLPAGVPVWTSPLRRCRELAAGLHPEPRCDPRLMEISFGEWEGRPWNDIGVALLDAWAANLAGFVPPGGESALALQARALDFVADLEGAEAVVVTHAGVMRMLLAHWQRLPAEDWTRLSFAYGAVTSVEVGDGGALLKRLNG